MADPVHPVASPSETSPLPAKPVPPPPASGGNMYIIQVPKDQIYRVPPPENSRKHYPKKNPRRSCCCRCLCYTLSTLLLILLLLAITAGILYLVFRPESPKYSIDDISIRGVSLTSSSSFSPAIDVAVRAHNPNNKLSIYYYQDGSLVEVYYSAVKLANGVVPTFDQRPNNITVIQTALTGSNIVWGNSDHAALVNRQRQGGGVPLKLRLRVPVKIKVGAVKTWKITVSVNCQLTVDNLTTNSSILSQTCDHSVKLW